jgi:hypothetical protein
VATVVVVVVGAQFELHAASPMAKRAAVSIATAC